MYRRQPELEGRGFAGADLRVSWGKRGRCPVSRRGLAARPPAARASEAKHPRPDGKPLLPLADISQIEFFMRIEGRLSKWDDDRGFGFITPSQGTPEIFVHISAFPKDGQRPVIGEMLTFEIELDNSGKKRAKNLVCPERPVRIKRQTTPQHRPKKPGLFAKVIPFAAVVVLALYGYGEYSRRMAPHATAVKAENNQATVTTFQCDGRTHCAQMTSCAEARFFLKHCPNVQMDGNNDGVPCEQQWCTSPFAQ